MFISLLIIPPFYQLVNNLLTYPSVTHARERENHVITPISWMEVLYNNFFITSWAGLSIDYNNIYDVIRSVIGGFPTFWYVMDDIFGPGVTIAATMTQLKTPVASAPGAAPPRFMIGNLLSTWVVATIAEIALSLFLGAHGRIVTACISAITAIYVWESIGKDSWAGKGIVATFTRLREQHWVDFGQGPGRTRLAIMFYSCMLTWSCYAAKTWSFPTVAILVLIMAFHQNERAQLAMLGIFTCSPLMIIRSLIDKLPITSPLAATIKQANTATDDS